MARNPTGVNVSTSGPTTLVIRFADNAGGTFTSTVAVFCAVPANALTGCPAGQSLGRLPRSLDRGSTSSAKGSITDVMTIPFSVVRRAVVSARQGNNSDFFYVRRFDPVGGANLGNGAGVPIFVNVTCRMAGGGARTPLSLTRVELFGVEPGDDKVRRIRLKQKNRKTGQIKADISYTGRGILQGYWEVRTPADPDVRELDRFTEGSLPEAQRIKQRRFRRIKRFRVQLPLSGRIILQGPRYSDLPRDIGGRHQVLLRVQATRDREQLSNLAVTGQSQRLFSGAAAGFPLPTLEYWTTAKAVDPGAVVPRLMIGSAGSDGTTPVMVVWTPLPSVPAVQIKVTNQDGETVFEGLAPGAAGRLLLPADRVDAENAKQHTYSFSLMGRDRQIIGKPIQVSKPK